MVGLYLHPPARPWGCASMSRRGFGRWTVRSRFYRCARAMWSKLLTTYELFPGRNLPRPARLETTSPATKAAGLVAILRLFCQQAFLCETSFLRDSPAKANKPMPNIVSIAGSGTAVGAFRLIVAPATLPLPPEGVPFRVAVNVPVTSGDSGSAPRKLNRAGFKLPAMKLAEKVD